MALPFASGSPEAKRLVLERLFRLWLRRDQTLSQFLWTYVESRDDEDAMSVEDEALLTDVGKVLDAEDREPSVRADRTPIRAAWEEAAALEADRLAATLTYLGVKVERPDPWTPTHREEVRHPRRVPPMTDHESDDLNYHENADLKVPAALMLVWHNGLLLAVSRRGRPQDLGLPGGKLLSRENVRRAALRELFEETGITPDGEVRFVYEAADGTPTGRRVFVFETRLQAVRPRIIAEEGIRVVWVSPSRLVQYPSRFCAFNRSLFEALAIDYTP